MRVAGDTPKSNVGRVLVSRQVIYESERGCPDLTMSASFLTGLAIGFGLILAIGAQNAFVLRQGLRGEHILLVCLTCAISDALLISAGVAGFGALVLRAPWIEPAFRIGGSVFLCGYGIRSLWASYRTKHALQAAETAAKSWQSALFTCLAFTWLNPHVYLDTVVLLGSASTQHSEHRVAFASGAVTASFLLFFSLGYGARLLQPIFLKPISWKVLDALVGVLMVTLGLRLLLSA